MINRFKIRTILTGAGAVCARATGADAQSRSDQSTPLDEIIKNPGDAGDGPGLPGCSEGGPRTFGLNITVSY